MMGKAARFCSRPQNTPCPPTHVVLTCTIVWVVRWQIYVKYCQQFMTPPATTGEVITCLTASRVYSRKCTGRKSPSRSIKHGSFFLIVFYHSSGIHTKGKWNTRRLKQRSESTTTGQGPNRITESKPHFLKFERSSTNW